MSLLLLLATLSAKLQHRNKIMLLSSGKKVYVDGYGVLYQLAD